MQHWLHVIIVSIMCEMSRAMQSSAPINNNDRNLKNFPVRKIFSISSMYRKNSTIFLLTVGGVMAGHTNYALYSFVIPAHHCNTNQHHHKIFRSNPGNPFKFENLSHSIMYQRNIFFETNFVKFR